MTARIPVRVGRGAGALAACALAAAALGVPPAPAASRPADNPSLASLAFCDAGQQLSAEQRDVLLRFAAAVKSELEASGAGLALIARSGLNLKRFEMRYSHAGITLRASPESPWAVRQLYYACDEKRPRIFDQGMSAFLMGTDDASTGYVSLVFLPAADAAELERRALDNALALALLGASYSANAYPFSTRHQNCNQWVMELLAATWNPQPADAASPERDRAQRWLRGEGYAPAVFELGGRPLMWFSHLVPWLSHDDHPVEDLDRHRFQVSMPDSIEAFVRARLPGARRVELCHDGRRVVLRRGWEPIAEGCEPGPQDTVLPLP